MANLESITSNPFFAFGNFILALIGILLAVFFYFRSKKNKVPRWQEASNTIIEGLHNSLDGLEVNYKGSVQERITVTKMVFRNAGKETINKADTVEKDPLRIEIPTFIEVLDIQVIDVSADSNSVSIKDTIILEDKATYPLEFEYLDHNEYFIIQIIHNASSEEKFEFKGKIKGVKKFKKLESSSIENIPLFGKTIAILFFLFFGAFLLFEFLQKDVENFSIVWFFTGIPMLFIGLAILIYLYKVYYALRNIVPIKLYEISNDKNQNSN